MLAVLVVVVPVLVLVQGCWGQDPGVTCSAIRNATTRSLLGCMFSPDERAEDSVVCEVMAQYGGPETPHDEVGFVHAKFSFTLLQHDLPADFSSLCVGATGLLTDKVYSRGNWSNATYARLNPVTEIVLPFIKTLRADLTFDATKAMAWLDLDRDCYLTHSRNSSCIVALRVVSTYWDLHLQDYNPFHTAFWSQLKRPYFTLLGAQMLTLEVSLKEKASVPFVQALVSMIINGTGLRTIRARGFTMGNVGRLLPPLPLLEQADFNHDGIQDMDPGNFAGTPNLTRLDLGSNFLREVPASVWSLRRLASLNLSGNALLASASLSAGLSALTSLRELSVSGVPLRTLPAALGPASLLRLHVLEAARCGLAGDALALQASLRSLDLSGNPLRSLAPDVFLRMRDLGVLLLADAGLHDAPRLRLHGDATLRLLDLSANKLVSADDVLLSGQVSLLNLSGNAVRGWDAAAFSHVRRVDVSRNALVALPPLMLGALAALDAVDVGDNPLDCDACATPQLQAWLGAPGDAPLVLRPDAVRCASPPQDAGRRVEDVVFRRASQCGFPLWAVYVAAGGGVALLALGVALRWRYEIRYVLHKRRRLILQQHQHGDHTYAYDASVLYSRRDRPWVEQLVRASRRVGLRLCLHEGAFPLQSLVTTRLEAALSTSRTTVVVLSPAFVADKWCSWALEMSLLFSGGGGGDGRLLLVELWPRLPSAALSRRLRALMEDPATPRLGWPAPGQGSFRDATTRLVNRLMGDDHILTPTERTPLLLSS